jgi:hypothetical protein
MIGELRRRGADHTVRFVATELGDWSVTTLLP